MTVGLTGAAGVALTVWPGRGQDRPDRQPDLVVTHPPRLAQVRDDGQAPPTHRRNAGMRIVRHSRTAAVAHRDLKKAIGNHPGDL